MRIDDIWEDAINAQISIIIDIQCFTDGSGFDNGIGGVVYSLILGCIARPVGLLETHTVYAGELEGIDAALSLMF